MARIDLPAGEGMDVAKALMLAPHFVDIVVGYEKDFSLVLVAPAKGNLSGRKTKGQRPS